MRTCERLEARKERQMNTEHATPQVIRLELAYLPSPHKEEKGPTSPCRSAASRPGRSPTYRELFVSSPYQPWAIRVSRADSSEALDRLMDAWHEGVTAGGGLQGAIGFDSHMERRDWESAKHSIERTYGRSSREHRFTLDTLSAAIQSRRMLGPRLTYPRLT